MKCRNCCTYCMFISGILFFIASFVLLIVWPYTYHRILTGQLVLSPTSTSYETWHDVPVPMYMEVYLYNFTNTEEVAANHSVKPRFTELGPYVFRERNLKVNETWFDHNSTITYYQNRTWQFEPEMSNGTLSDEVTNINVILASVARAVKGLSSLIIRILNTAFEGIGQDIFVTRTVRELLYEGYNDSLLDLVKDLSSINVPNLPSIDIPYDRFGWFYPRNGSETYDGEFNIFTGADDINKLGLMNTWNGENKTDFYGEGCNKIGGTTGELWPLNIEGDNVTLFVSDICGTITLKYKGEDVSVEGITGSLFVGDDSVFDNGWHYPETACFCTMDQQSQCMPSGVLDVSKCRFNAPVFLSFPHFYLADESYLNAVEGLSPDKERDEFRIILQRDMGLPLSVRGQIQVNVLIEHLPNLNIVNNRMPEMLVPMIWSKQVAGVTDDYASLVRLILDLRWGINIFLYCLLSISIVAIITAIALFMTRHLRNDPERAVLMQGQDTN